ncbi:hypothetical protein Mapa_016314 [Marchantia paleacea]|nr:hypothetical protein Mapa_016314 [Marchantia paleacea]
MGSQVSSPLVDQTFSHVDSRYPTILNELTKVSMTTNFVTAGLVVVSQISVWALKMIIRLLLCFIRKG